MLVGLFYVNGPFSMLKSIFNAGKPFFFVSGPLFVRWPFFMLADVFHVSMSFIVLAGFFASRPFFTLAVVC